jgi:hypothetical protein
VEGRLCLFMLHVGIESFLAAFLILGMLFFLLASIYYDRRDRRLYDDTRRQHVHHCVKCGKTYTSSESGAAVACPACLFKNSALRF